jgi:hypothetical protein
VAIFIPLASADNHDHSGTVDVLYFEGKCFGNAQAAAIHHGGAHANDWTANQFDEAMRFLSIKYYRQLGSRLGAKQSQCWPRSLQRLGKQEFDTKNLGAQCTAGYMLLFHQVSEVVA